MNRVLKKEKTMTTHLLNRAVMPQPGFYDLREIDSQEFARLVQEAHQLEHLQHHISVFDRTTLAFLERLTGINLEKRHWRHSITYNFEIADGDTFLVMSFKYRIIPHHRRSDGPRLNDFLFYKGKYETQNRKTDGTIITINIRIRIRHFVAQREDGTPYGYGIVLDIPNRERQIDFTIRGKEGFHTQKVNTLEDILEMKGVVRFQWQKNKYLTSGNTINKDGIYVELTPNFEIPNGLTKSEQLIYEILKMNEGKTIRKETLAQLTSAIISPSSFQSHISRLRKKIKPLGEQIKYKNNAYRLTKKLEIEKYNCL